MIINNIKNMTFEDIVRVLYDAGEYIESYDALIEYVKYCADNDALLTLQHITDALINTPAKFYKYDCGMGIFETPQPLITIDDLIEYFEIEEE